MTDPSTNTPGADSRDYSLNMPATTGGPGITLPRQGTPVVPNSSFSFQYTLGDSARPEEQLPISNCPLNAKCWPRSPNCSNKPLFS